MTALAQFRHLARGGQKPVEQQHDKLPDTDQPGVAVTQFFPYQSYFSSTLLEQALLQQSVNSQIVDSKTPGTGFPATPMVESNVSGYCIGLHPSSDTPVAVQPQVGGMSTSPNPVILKPGQIYRPFGRPFNKSGAFSSVNWGIPFGWLGGGVATLYIFASPDADAAWPGNPEIIFHRQRMVVIDPAAIPGTYKPNWPTRFPWLAAKRSPDLLQAGQPVISIEPSKTLMSLRTAAVPATLNMRILVKNSDAFDLDVLGANTGDARFLDYTWGTYATTANAYPVVTAPYELTNLGCNTATDNGVVLAADAGSALIGSFVDIVRYGRL